MQTIFDGLRIEEATLELVADSASEEPTRVVPPEPTRRIPIERKTELIAAARRHPATLALIEEITAQVEASAGRQIELAKAELRNGVVFHHGLFHRIDLVTLGVFTTVNLMLVTLAFALSRVMAPWLAGLLVSAISLAGTATAIFRSSTEPGARLPALRRFAVRRFARRLFAGV
ncbi:MAG TPA: hypothetical protein VMU46_15545 [Burkholderiales bacterium]|nr:hypothetical protein [Burkholderiales bacterium]